MSGDTVVELEVPDNLDILSDLKFMSSQTNLLACSWDNKVLLYDCSDINNKAPINILQTEDTPLTVAFGPGNSTFIGFLDGTIRELDYENIKLHICNSLSQDQKDFSQGINNLVNVHLGTTTFAASTFKGKLEIVDTRMRSPVSSRQCEKKILKMDATKQYLAVGMSDRRVEIYDHRNWTEPYQIRESGLRYQIQDLQCFPTGEGFAISSIDGRVAIEYFDPSELSQARKYAFKCHRHLDKEAQRDLVHSVNSILFSRRYNTLFTSGSDGHVCLWNWQKRKRMRQYPRLTHSDGTTQSIVRTAIQENDSVLAIGTSDESYKSASSIEESTGGVKRGSKIYLRYLKETECLPKH